MISYGLRSLGRAYALFFPAKVVTTTAGDIGGPIPGGNDTLYGYRAQVTGAPVGSDLVFTIKVFTRSTGVAARTLATVTIPAGSYYVDGVFTADQLLDTEAIGIGGVSSVGSGTPAENLVCIIYGTAGAGGSYPIQRGTFQARLDTATSLSDSLTLLPFGGDRIEIDAQELTVPGAGIACAKTDNLITAAGANAGAAPSASTAYYAYVSNALASYAPSSLRLCATAPTILNGAYYLDTTGNGRNWRYVGRVRLNATPKFESSDQNLLIKNFYNKLWKRAYANPGYSDDNAQTTYAVNGNWAAANGGTNARVTVLADGVDMVRFGCRVTAQALTAIKMLAGVGIDGAAPLRASSEILSGGTGNTAHLATDDSDQLAAGYHTLDLYGASSGGAGTFIADEVRLGAAADPRVSIVFAEMQV